MSIENQRMILREKALSLSGIDHAEIREFVDNGHTGTNFERPAMQELLSLVQGKPGCLTSSSDKSSLRDRCACPPADHLRCGSAQRVRL
ncbi:MAG: hypothetical protein IKH57_13795 [Clostridia bacterium]|nr:hypothetical protein [Clostridia bacterium]